MERVTSQNKTLEFWNQGEEFFNSSWYYDDKKIETAHEKILEESSIIPKRMKDENMMIAFQKLVGAKITGIWDEQSLAATEVAYEKFGLGEYKNGKITNETLNKMKEYYDKNFERNFSSGQLAGIVAIIEALPKFLAEPAEVIFDYIYPFLQNK